MNSNSKPGGPPGKKKPGRPRNDVDLSSIGIRQPLPPAPVLSEISTSPKPSAQALPPASLSISPKVFQRSPIDQTPIIVNGKVVDLDSELEERVRRASPVIKPVTPIPERHPELQSYETPSTPPSLPIPEVDIIETPQVTPRISEGITSEYSNETLEEVLPETLPILSSVPPLITMRSPSVVSTVTVVKDPSPKNKYLETIREPDLEVSSEEELESVPESNQIVAEHSKHTLLPPKLNEVVKIETLPNKPLNFTALLTENQLSPSSSEDSGTYITESSEEQSPKKNPFDIRKQLNLVGSYASDAEESDEESDEENTPLIPMINMPSEQPSIPKVSGRFRADSPIETIGAPGSPNIPSSNAKPMFNPDGRSSYTPVRRVASPVLKNASGPSIGKIQEDSTQTPSIRNVISPSPKPGSRIPSPIRPGASPRSPNRPRSPLASPKQQTISGPALFFPPQPSQNGSIFGGRPDYSKMTLEQQVFMRTQFMAKFGILRSSYPDWQIRDPDDRLTLDQVHDVYEYYIRQIMVSKETGQYKVYLVIFFMFVEVVGVKLLKLNMSGYTMSQLRIMNRYDTLLAELGEKWLVSSGSDWPVEARLLMMATFNAVIFIAVRYLCSWMGVDGLSETIQNFVDSMLNGPQQNLPGAPGITAPAAPPPPPPPSHYNPPPSTGNPLDGLASAFSGLFGGNNNSSGGNAAGGFSEGIAKLGTMFTNKIQQSNKAAAAAAPTQTAAKAPVRPNGVKGRIDKKTLFG